MPFVIRWIVRSAGAFVLSRVARYLRSPQGRAMLRRQADRLRRGRHRG